MTRLESNEWLHRVGDQEVASAFRRMLESGMFTARDSWVVAYDLGRLRRRLEQVKRCFGPNALHTLAIKACPLRAILEFAVGHGFGLEAASIEEVHLALAAGCAPEHIVFDSPAKTREELSSALRRGVRINADNLDELARIAAIRDSGSLSDVGLRINPEVGVGSISMTSVAGNTSKFGVPLSRCRTEVERSFERYPWLNGLHVHVGSQGCDLALLSSAALVVEELRTALQERFGPGRITWVDIGGGLPADYGFSTRAIDPYTYAEAIRTLVPGLYQQPLITEFGRSLLANCAWAVSRIEYVKRLGGVYTAVIHFGADFLMRPVYAPNDWKHRIVILDSQGRVSANEAGPVSIAGPLCFAGDYLARGEHLPTPSADGFVAVNDVGAYTLSLWCRHCSRRLPKVLGYDGAGDHKQAEVLFAGESIGDVVRFWS